MPFRPDSGPTGRTALSGSEGTGSEPLQDAGNGARNVWPLLRNTLGSRRNRVGRI